MARIQGIADLAVRLEAADAWPLAGPRVHHHDRPLARVGRDSRWRHDARERVVDRPWQRPAAHQHFMIEAQHGRHRPRCNLDLFVATLPQQIEKENAALERIDHVLRPARHQIAGSRCGSLRKSEPLKAERACCRWSALNLTRLSS